MLLAMAVGALGLTAGCGGDDSKPKESKAELEAELAKLPKHIEDDFRAGDKNHDLRLQDTELDAMIKEDFEAMDVVKDGEINEADIRKDEDKNPVAGGKRGEKAKLDVEASLAFMDLNKDGRVPFEEYKEHVDRHFHQAMDTNKDGHIDPSESVAFYQRLYGEAK
jgi:hypothetical protein